MRNTILLFTLSLLFVACGQVEHISSSPKEDENISDREISQLIESNPVFLTLKNFNGYSKFENSIIETTDSVSGEWMFYSYFDPDNGIFLTALISSEDKKKDRYFLRDTNGLLIEGTVDIDCDANLPTFPSIKNEMLVVKMPKERLDGSRGGYSMIVLGEKSRIKTQKVFNNLSGTQSEKSLMNFLAVCIRTT